MEVTAVDRLTGFAPGDHIFWAFDGPRAFAAASIPYLAEGRRRGERLLYVGAHTQGALIEHLSAFPERDLLLAAGQLSVRPLTAIYEVERSLDPRAQSEVLRAETVAAVDAGYQGLRIAADVTALAEDPRLIPQLAAYELAVDEMIAGGNAVVGLCGYDERRVGERVGAIAALHSIQHHDLRQPTFAADVRGGTMFLGGEIDLAVTDEFGEVCRTVQESTVGPLIVDMRDLAFIDAAGTRVLARFAHDMRTADGSATAHWTLAWSFVRARGVRFQRRRRGRRAVCAIRRGGPRARRTRDRRRHRVGAPGAQ